MDRLTVCAFTRTAMLQTHNLGGMLPTDGRILPTSQRGIVGEYPRFIAPRLDSAAGSDVVRGWMTPDGLNDGVVADFPANFAVNVHERDVLRSRRT